MGIIRLSRHEPKRVAEISSPIQGGLAAGELLCHVEKQPPVLGVDLAEELPDFGQEAPLLGGGFCHGQFFRRLPFAQLRQRRRFVPFIKEHIEGELQGRSESLQSFQGRYGMAILYPGNVTAEQTGPFLNVTL